MSIHERPIGATVEWFTPVGLFLRLRLPDPPWFDLDPAASPEGVGTFVPARTLWRKEEDGLSREWFGHVWLNPPYGRAGLPFIDRMIAHDDGLMLLPSRTETAAYQRALAAADVVCLLRDRLWFTRADGFIGRSSFGSTLFAFGEWAAGILIASDLGWTAVGHYVVPVPAPLPAARPVPALGAVERTGRRTGAPAGIGVPEAPEHGFAGAGSRTAPVPR